MKIILAAPDLLKIEKTSFRSDEVRLVVKTRLPKSACPSCERQSDKAHSRYQWRRSCQSLGNCALDDRTRLAAFWRRHQRIVVWLVLSQMELDGHTRRSRLCGQIDAVGIEKVERTGEYDHRRQ